jgi:hypothetical protein
VNRVRYGKVDWRAGFAFALLAIPLEGVALPTTVDPGLDLFAVQEGPESEEVAGKDTLPPSLGGEPEVWAEDEYMEAPRQHVARLIRAALQSPENQRAWTDLAEALPELEAEGELDSATLKRAAEIADSLAFASGSPTTPANRPVLGPESSGAVGKVMGTLSAWFGDLEVGWERTLQSTSVNQWFLLASLTVLLFVLLVLRKLRVKKASVQAPEPTDGNDEDGTATGLIRSLNAAQALWHRGLPANEVARETGLPQDVLNMVAALQGGQRR